MANISMTDAPKRNVVVVALFIAELLKDFESTIVVTAMPTIAARLDGTTLYAWVFIAYLFAAVIGQPLIGKLADLRGRKPVILGATGLFVIGTIACGSATSMEMLIACRVVQGLGGGGMHVVAGALVGDLFDARTQAKIAGLFTASLAIGGGLGPIVGGLIVEAAAWRWVFWGVVPIAVACAVLIAFGVTEQVEVRRRPFDFAGTALLSAAIAAILAAGHSPRHSVVCLLLGVIFIAGFIRVERRASEPLIPLWLFQHRVIGISTVCIFLSGAALLPTLAFLPLYVQGVLGHSAAAAGWTIMPLTFGWISATLCAARLLSRIGYRPFVRWGLFIAVLGAAWQLLAVTRAQGLEAMQAAVFLFGLGIGLADAATWIAMQTSVGNEVRSVTTAVNTVVFSVGGILGVGFLGTMLGGQFAGVEMTNASEVAESLALAFPTMLFVILAILVLASMFGLLFPVLHVPAASRPEDESRVPEI